MTSIYHIYDGTFEGLLTCIFDAFFRKEFPSRILRESSVDLFATQQIIVSDTEKADRVLNGLKKKISGSAINMLFVCKLAETEETDLMIFNYIKKAFASKSSIELNFADNDVLALSKIYKKVMNEAEKMRQFVRFQKTADDIFFAYFRPLFDVLPFNAAFFEDRFADQKWIVYDGIRKYGLYYDLKITEIIHFDNIQINEDTGQLFDQQAAHDEKTFESLWQQYFKSITIKERINLKLQRQHMPKRFWKYLPEKRI